MSPVPSQCHIPGHFSLLPRHCPALLCCHQTGREEVPRGFGACVTSLGCGGGSRDSGTQRLGDLGTQGQARLPLTPVATQDNSRSQSRAGMGNVALDSPPLWEPPWV